MKSKHPLPGSLWIAILLLLLAVFTTEATIMFVLPWVMPTKNSPQFEVFIDAALLTLLLVPLLWWLFFDRSSIFYGVQRPSHIRRSRLIGC